MNTPSPLWSLIFSNFYEENIEVAPVPNSPAVILFCNEKEPFIISSDLDGYALKGASVPWFNYNVLTGIVSLYINYNWVSFKWAVDACNESDNHLEVSFKRVFDEY